MAWGPVAGSQARRAGSRVSGWGLRGDDLPEGQNQRSRKHTPAGQPVTLSTGQGLPPPNTCLCVCRPTPHQALLCSQAGYPGLGAGMRGSGDRRSRLRRDVKYGCSSLKGLGGCWGVQSSLPGGGGGGASSGAPAGKVSRRGRAALARGQGSGRHTQPGEQAFGDTALLDGLLHHEPVLAQLPGGRHGRVCGWHLIQDPQLWDELPHLCPIVVAGGHLQGGGRGGPGSSGAPPVADSSRPSCGCRPGSLLATRDCGDPGLPPARELTL